MMMMAVAILFRNYSLDSKMIRQTKYMIVWTSFIRFPEMVGFPFRDQNVAAMAAMASFSILITPLSQYGTNTIIVIIILTHNENEGSKLSR
jgi:hypothetical protein